MYIYKTFPNNFVMFIYYFHWLFQIYCRMYIYFLIKVHVDITCIIIPVMTDISY